MAVNASARLDLVFGDVDGQSRPEPEDPRAVIRMLDCMEILAIAAKREIRVYAIKGNWHLDETIQSKIMAMVFSMAAEIELGLISARTKEALCARRASGLPVGRPKGPGKSKLDKYRPEIEALLANGSTQKFIAKRYKSSPANLANWLKKRGIKKSKL